MWGNPTDDAAGTLRLKSSRPIDGLPESIAIKKGDGPRVIENLVANSAGDIDLKVSADGQHPCAVPTRFGL